MDITGTNWVAEGIWTQHTLSGFWASGSGGAIRNSRMTTIWADGANINNVALDGSSGNNLTMPNNFVRGTGDDALAVNSVNCNDINGTRVYYTPMANATVTGNTSIAPWGGKGIGIYGGSGHRVETTTSPTPPGTPTRRTLRFPPAPSAIPAPLGATGGDAVRRSRGPATAGLVGARDQTSSWVHNL